MLVNNYCYVEKKDIETEIKGNEETNVNCVGCMYLDFCKEEVNKKVIKPTAKNKVKTDEEKEDKKADKKEKVTKIKPTVTQRPKKGKNIKKETIEDLAEEDIF